MIYETLWARTGSDADFNAGKTQLVLFDWSNNTGAIYVKKKRSVLEGKSSLLRCWLGLTFSSKLYWGSNIISIAKTVPKKIRALIRSVKFLSPETKTEKLTDT